MIGLLLQRLFPATAALCLLALPATAEPAFWRVSDTDSSVYLFGSVHAFDRELDWRSDEFNRQLREADHVYFEMLFGEDVLGAFARAIILDGPLTDGRTLSDLLSPEQYQRVQDAIADANMSPAPFDRARPWMVEFLLTSSGLTGSSPGVELTVTGEIEPERLRAFESMEDQMAFFSGHSEAEQIENLMETLDEAEQGNGSIAGIVDDWFTADLEGIEAYNKSLNPARFRTLIADRNTRWAETISGLLDTNDDALIIVGVAHLVGDAGVPQLLGEMGFTVERIDAR